MHVFNIEVPDKALTNIELSTYAEELKIPHFRGVFMRDTLPRHPYSVECGIVNLNISHQPGSHWVCYCQNKCDRIYFYSYGQIFPSEIQHIEMTGSEFDRQRNTDIVQAANTHSVVTCLFILKLLTNGKQFETILNLMQHYGGYT